MPKLPKKLTSTWSSLDPNKKTNFILIAALVLIILGVIIGYNRIANRGPQGPLQEVDLPFDPTGPYALLVPRDDGRALILDITRVGDYDAISYDLEYQSNGIDRGVHGDIKKLGQGNKKSDYSQEILFGTCSQGFTRAGPHCVFDPNVENGTLTLHIQKGDKAYRMISTWHLQQPDVALGQITSGDGHFIYNTSADRQTLNLIGWTIVNDLSGLPKLPDGKDVMGKVYALNVPTTKSFPSGQVEIDLANNPPTGAQIAKYTISKNSWSLLDTKTASSSGGLTSQANGDGIYAVLIPQTKK